MITLRPYQQAIEAEIYREWQNVPWVLACLSTGGGKTAIIGSLVSKHSGASVVIAHRDTIVAQLSLMLARFGIRHNIIASAANCRQIADLHVKATGANWYSPNERCAVASVDTLIRRKDIAAWCAKVTLAIVDEGHHVVEDNKWHKAIQKFTHPALRGLLPTATPRRADNKGLGRPPVGDGIADVMVMGPPMSWLMDQGYLTRYHPPICADSHMAEVVGDVGSTGDWSTAQLRSAAERSTIVGDVVKTYQRICQGFYRGIEPGQRLAVVFAPEVKTATEMLQAYRAAGIKAEMLTGETDATVRARAFKDFAARKIHVILAVDIISEGTDMPAVEVIIGARLTASLSVYMQQFGRGLRPMWGGAEPCMDETPEAQGERLAAIAGSGKEALVYVDHVGNFLRHGPPDRPREWTLASYAKSRGPSGAIPQRVCLEVTCGHPYERVLDACPYCGTLAPAPAGRDSPAVVEGDMQMMDPAVLDALLGKVKEAGLTLDEYRAKLAVTGLPQTHIWRNAKYHDARLQAAAALREVMAYWGGVQLAAGYTDRQMQKLFWYKFGISVLEAQVLGRVEAEALMERVALDMAAI